MMQYLMKATKTLLIFPLLPALFTIGIFCVYGLKAWDFWNIPTLSPSFTDARIITAGAESYRLGFDPEIENPQDPYGRLFNLPYIWKILFLTGLNQNYTDIIGVVLIVLYWLGLVSFTSHYDDLSLLLLAICAFSPPVLLAFERGNVELFIFFICAISLMWVDKSWVVFVLILWLAGTLKIYPIFGMIALIGSSRKSFYNYSACFILAFGIYSLLTFDNIRHVISNTEVGFDLSYGLSVLPFYIQSVNGKSEFVIVAGLLSVFLAILIIFFSFHRLTHTGNSLDGKDSHYLSAFRLGAGIYAGTFLLGTNWDYRLIFLLFTLPQLANWAGRNKMAKYTLMAVLVSFLYLWIALFLPFAYFLDEIANWSVFAGLIYLTAISFPYWIKDDIGQLLERYEKKTS